MSPVVQSFSIFFFLSLNFACGPSQKVPPQGNQSFDTGSNASPEVVEKKSEKELKFAEHLKAMKPFLGTYKVIKQTSGDQEAFKAVDLTFNQKDQNIVVNEIFLQEDGSFVGFYGWTLLEVERPMHLGFLEDISFEKLSPTEVKIVDQKNSILLKSMDNQISYTKNYYIGEKLRSYTVILEKLPKGECIVDYNCKAESK